MRVLLTSTSYPSDAKDWRGRFIADMTAALAKHSEVDLDVWIPPGFLPPEVGNVATEAEARWLSQLLQQGGMAQVLRKRGPLALVNAWKLLARLRDVYQRTSAEVLHINWLQNALPLPVTNKPALITVLGTDFALLKLPGMISMLRRAFRQRRVILAPNAGWMAEKLERHFGDLVEVRPIPFGIDPAWFDIERRVHQEGPLNWLVVTRLTLGKLGSLFEWGEGVFGNNHILHILGPRQDENVVIPSWVRYHGPTHPAVLRNEWFPQSAGLITLSQHDEGRPQVMLEAMAAGLPIIASTLPGHLEIIQNRKTGLFVNNRQELKEALEFLSNTLDNRAMGEAAKVWAKDHIGSWADCAERYFAAYCNLLKS